MPWLLVFMKSARTQQRLHNARAFYALLDGAVASWERLVDGTQGAALIRKRGLAIIYETERGFDSAAADRATLREFGAELTELNGAEVRQSEPRALGCRHSRNVPPQDQSHGQSLPAHAGLWRTASLPPEVRSRRRR